MVQNTAASQTSLIRNVQRVGINTVHFPCRIGLHNSLATCRDITLNSTRAKISEGWQNYCIFPNEKVGSASPFQASGYVILESSRARPWSSMRNSTVLFAHPGLRRFEVTSFHSRPQASGKACIIFSRALAIEISTFKMASPMRFNFDSPKPCS